MSSMPEFVDSVLSIVINQKLIPSPDGGRKLVARIYENRLNQVIEL